MDEHLQDIEMNIHRSVITMAIVAALGGTQSQQVHSASLPDGEYDMVVLPTPTSTFMGQTFGVFGSDGDWNSSFSFGILPSSSQPFPQPMTDNGAEVNQGSTVAPAKGIAGDGFAGIIRIKVSASSSQVVSFSKDVIFATAGGNFGQSVDPAKGVAQMTLSIDKAAGSLILRPTGRLGNIDQPVLVDQPWLIDDAPATGACNPSTSTGNTDWLDFTTGSVTNNNGTITGKPLANISDVNGDGTSDLEAVLVTGGSIGTNWGTFCGAQFFEVWRINLLPFAIDDAVAVSQASSKEMCVLDNDGVGGGATIGASSVTAPGITSVGSASLGTVVVNSASANCSGKDSLTYTSNAAAGTDSFTYTITNSQGQTSTATVAVTVSNNPVVAGNDGPLQVQQGPVSASIPIATLTANDSTSAAGANIVDSTISPVSPAANGGVVAVSGINIDYTPPAVDFVGTDSFSYTIQDSAGNTSAPATVLINVTAFGLVDSGVYSAGATASAKGANSGILGSNDVAADNSVSAICVGGCFDFVVSGANNPVQVVPPPLSLPVSEGLQVRLLAGGAWSDYDTTGVDAVASSPLSAAGGCPAPTDSSWVAFNGVTAAAGNAGHECLRFTLADNTGAGDGPNDNDNTSGTVVVTAGLSAPVVAQVTSSLQNDFDNNVDGGCVLGSSLKRSTVMSHSGFRLDWLLVSGCIVFLRWYRKKQIRSDINL